MTRKALFNALLLMIALVLAACSASQITETAPPVEIVPQSEASATLPPPTATGIPSETPVDETAVPAEAPAPVEAVQNESGRQFTIVAEESEARFLIDEVLLGAPKTVVGATNAVTGALEVDLAAGTASSLEVEVDLSTLVTDNSNRTRALHNNILHTNQPEFQYAYFEGLAFENLPDSVTTGQSIDFQVRGNLTIHGVTKEVVFDVSLTPISETRFEGLALLTIAYADYDVHILRLPQQVASVEEVTTLELAFTAEDNE
jgi:polyisoprenoid-binding protein YceI